MKLYGWRKGGASLVMFLAVGCSGGQNGDLPRAPASSGNPTPAAEEKSAGKAKTMAPADAAEKYK